MSGSEEGPFLPAADIRRTILDVLRRRGQPATSSEIETALADVHKLSAVQRERLIERTRSARMGLESIGVLQQTSTGAWGLTDIGKTARAVDIEKRIGEARYEEDQTQRAWADLRYLQPGADAGVDTSDQPSAVDRAQPAEMAIDWKSEMLRTLSRLKPDDFERLTQELLTALGYDDVSVTRPSRDGGIDGRAIDKRGLFPVQIHFQCKRYKGSVGTPAVRDFRGAIDGRDGQGLIITTGTFTNEARTEARRSGARRIELIDGHRLCEYLRDQGIGPSPMRGSVSVTPRLFDQFEQD